MQDRIPSVLLPLPCPWSYTDSCNGEDEKKNCGGRGEGRDQVFLHGNKGLGVEVVLVFTCLVG